MGMAVPVVREGQGEVALAGGEMLPCHIASAQDGDPDAPAVIVIADMLGPSPFYRALCARLATAGFRAVLPDYFFRQEPLAERSHEAAFARRKHLDEPQALTDLAACIDAYRGGPRRVGVVGFCMGGTFTLDLSADRDDLAGVSYYGFPAAATQVERPAPRPIDVANRITGPLLGFWGEDDDAVGGMEPVRAFDAALRASGADWELVTYPGLGHGFLGRSNLDKGHSFYEPACDSWTRTIAFLRRHLAPQN